MVTGSTKASHCDTQPTYATVTKNYYAHKSMPKKRSHITNRLPSKISGVYFKFPGVFQN